MLRKDWRNNKKLIETLLSKAGLDDVRDAGELKTTMRCVIWYKYVDLMTINESLARLAFDHNIDICARTYNRILKKAVELLEKYE